MSTRKKNFFEFFFQGFWLGENREKIGGFCCFLHIFTKKSIKQRNISMKVDNLVEHVNSEKLFICT